MTVKRRDVPRYGRITSGSHDWYVRSWSDSGSTPGVWSVWCEDCKDFHAVQEIDPVTLPEGARSAFAQQSPDPEATPDA